MSKLLDYFDRDELAADVWKSKYATEEEETPDDMHRRLAREFARIEEEYINKEYTSKLNNPPIWNSLSHYGRHRDELTEESIFNLFQGYKYIVPQGSVCSTLGTDAIASLSNCLRLPSPDDSYNSILWSDTMMVNAAKRRCGYGIGISNLRPRGAKVHNTAKTSTGAVSFMHRYSFSTNEVAQGGRRGACLIDIDIRHPDVEEFITVKSDSTKVTGANISIKIRDDFMKAVNNDNDYILRYPCNFYEENPTWISDIEEVGKLEDVERRKLFPIGVMGDPSKIIGYTKTIKAKLKESERLYKGALSKLLPMQRSDFVKIFTVMNGFPVTIRLLDPPLHEFLPKEKHLQIVLAKKMGMILKEIRDRVDSLHETNPMLGLRGCRLGIIYPDIYQMQIKAIMEAACAVKKKGIKVVPEIMVPLVGTDEEMRILKKDVKMVANEVLAKKGVKIDYKIGTMIEIPRAALTADRIAEYAEFFSFGTNDLTQMTYGYSRDDVGSFVPLYTTLGILEKDPFQVLDQDGVGQLVTTGIKKGRQTKPGLKVGICGEHGGEPSSIQFCHRNGMDYVSCSPFRVPIARLSAAQAVIKEKQ